MSSIQIAETFIKYGVFITNPSLLPFSVERDSGLEEWWKEGTNFSPSPSIYSSSNYADCLIDIELNEYWDNYYKWRAVNPLPIEIYKNSIVPNQCILAIPDIGIETYGMPILINSLPKIKKKQRQNLIAFLSKYNIKYEGEPNWYVIPILNTIELGQW